MTVIFYQVMCVRIKGIFESATYALSHLPFEDELLTNAQFVDMMRRSDSYFEQVQYFVERFSGLLPFLL